MTDLTDLWQSAILLSGSDSGVPNATVRRRQVHSEAMDGCFVSCGAISTGSGGLLSEIPVQKGSGFGIAGGRVGGRRGCAEVLAHCLVLITVVDCGGGRGGGVIVPVSDVVNSGQVDGAAVGAPIGGRCDGSVLWGHTCVNLLYKAMHYTIRSEE